MIRVILFYVFWLFTLGAFEIFVEHESNGITYRINLPGWSPKLSDWLRKRK